LLRTKADVNGKLKIGDPQLARRSAQGLNPVPIAPFNQAERLSGLCLDRR